jgi:hypothetical protein
MLRRYLLALLAILSLFFSSASLALPFNIVAKAGTQLPTQVELGASTTAYYTVTNNNDSQRNDNYVKHLPPNVTQVTTGGTYPDTCGQFFNLAANGKSDDSCTLQLTITGPVNDDDVPDLHLFVCFPGGVTCAGTPEPLNVAQTFPVSIAITPVSASIDSRNTQQYTAIGTFADGLTINVTPLLNWSSSNTVVATISSSGLATGVSLAGGTTTISASINGVTSNLATLNVAAAMALIATPSTNTEVGAVYSQTNVASGGFTPYVYSISAGAVPPGTTLNTATGTVSGTATTGGPFSYTIKVTDPNGKTATASTSGTIAAAVTLTATPSADKEVGVAYSQTNVASRGITPYIYSVSAGTLPAGTTLNTATGTVSGTPTTAGAFSYTIQVTDYDGRTATAATSGTIAATLVLTATSSTNTQVGIAYAQTNVASGGVTPYLYSISAGTLPAGTTLNTTTGTVSGTPTTSGAFSYTIEVTDGEGITATAQTSGTIASVGLVATPSTDTEVGAAYSQTNVASAGFTPYVYSVFAGTLPAGTTLSPTTGTVSGTPTTAGAFSYTIEVTDHNGNTATAATSGTIAVAIALTATPSTDTEIGVAYSQVNTVSGGIAPYLYSVSGGTLPAGTTLDATTGTVSGTPTTAGAFSYTIKVTDHDGQAATAETIGTIAAVVTLTATPSTNTEVGAVYSQVNTVSGGVAPYTYSVSAGAVPAGTTLDTATGTVSGTPTTAAIGAFSYTIEVTDSDGVTATAATSGTIAATVTIVATPSTFTEVGVAYSQTNVASNGVTPYTYTLSAGSLPAGTTLSPTTGTVSGTPLTAAAGAFSYTITVTDADGLTASASTSGTIATQLGLVATPSDNTEVGATYSQANTVSGGTAPYTYSVSAGAVPAGTALDTATGTVSGTPTIPAAGAFSYTITVTDADGATATASTSGTIAAELTLTATPSVNTEVGAVYSQANTVSGGTAPYTYSVAGGTLPSGTSLNPANGTVSGTPTFGGTFSYTIAVTDLDGVIATAATSGTMTGGVALTATPSTDTVVGRAYSQTNVASGGTAPYTYSVVAGAVPGGTTLNPATGTVSGTPTTAGPISYTIEVTDHNGATATAATSGTMAAMIALTATPSTDTGVGAAYSQVNTVSGGKGPYSYSVFAGAVPAGTTLSPTTGTVSGTPTTAGVFNYTIEVTDSENFTATAQTTGTIAAALTLTATPSTNTEVTVAYSQTNVASGGIAPYTYSVTAGTVPAGTTLNPATGTVSGTPTTSGSFSYTITVNDSDGATTSAPTTGTISSAVALTATPSANTEVGVTYSQANTASGGIPPYTYSVSGGAVPAGTTLSPTTGTVSGTPTAAGGFNYTIKVTDSNGATATAPTSGSMTAGVTLTATASANTEVGASYSQFNTVGGGTAPYAYTLSAGTLPAGTTLSPTTGTVSGTPTIAAVGAFSYTIEVTDSLGATATAPTTGTIAAAVTLAATPSPNTQVGVAYSQTNVASNGVAPYTYSTSAGGLPAGTSLSPTTGTVSGTPTTAATYNYTIKVTDNDGITATASTSVTIIAALANDATSSSDTENITDKSSGISNKSAVEYTFNGTTGDTVNHMRLCLATDASCNSCSNPEDIATSIDMGTSYRISNETLTNYLTRYTSALSAPGKPNSTYYIGVYVSATGANCSTPNGAPAYCGTSNAGRKTQTPMCITANSINGATVSSVSNNSSDVYLTKPAQYVYASNQTDNNILQCVPNSDGSFSNCFSIASIISPYATAFTSVNGIQYAYVTAGDGNVYQCTLSSDGANTFTCNALQHGGVTPSSPQAIAFLTINHNQYVYLGNSNGSVYMCPVSNDGSFGVCSSTTMTNGSNAIAFQARNKKQYIYGVNSNGSIEKCTVSFTDGTLSSCGIQSGPAGTPTSLVFESLKGTPLVYVTSNNSGRNFVYYSRLDVNGNFSSWTSTNNPTGTSTLTGISFSTVNNTLYANVSTQDGTVYQCTINSTSGNLDSCSHSSKTSATLTSSVTPGYALADSQESKRKDARVQER